MTDNESPDRDYRRRRLIASIGSGLTALANMATTLGAGAPSSRAAGSQGSQLSEYARKIYDKELARSDRLTRERADQALRKLRTDADIALGQRRESREAAALELRQREQQSKAESRAAADERANRLTERRIADIDSRIAQRERPAPPRAAARPRGKTFTWIHPDTGERFTVDRSTWDKSSYTMLQIVADATRPKPDARGYPTVNEWRRHCIDIYSGADRRDSFIMRNLPGVPAALDYLRRIGSNK